MLTVHEDIDTRIIIPQRNLTAETAEELRKNILPLIESRKGVRFDFSRVEDMDPICLNLLLVFGEMNGARNPDRSIEITGANNDLANLFRMMRLDRLFKMV